MLKALRILLSVGALSAMLSGCGDDHMSMSDDVAQVTSHQAELQTELLEHHRTVLSMNDVSGVISVENDLGTRSAGHLDEMDHLMRDMQNMCSMGERAFDGGQMTDTIGRVRTGLDEHRRRMTALHDLNALYTEEGAFRDMMTGLMGEMRGREADMRTIAMHYSCRMHGH